MADLTIDDLLHWERGLTLRPAVTSPTSADTDAGRPISWAVALRARQPIVPPLRGDEVVIAPERILARIQLSEGLSKAEVVQLLASQPLAALMVERVFLEAVPDDVGIPFLISSGTFVSDAEAILNRLFTERRAHLYGVGQELSRALTTATMSPSPFDALLNAAAETVRRRLVLVDGGGNIVAQSAVAATERPLHVAALLRLSGPEPRRVEIGARSWLVMPVQTDAREQLTVGIALMPQASTEVERLALTHVAGALELLLGQASTSRGAALERRDRQAQLRDVLAGATAPTELLGSREDGLRIEESTPTRLVVFAGAGAQRVGDRFGQRSLHVATQLPGDEFVVLLVGTAAAESNTLAVAGLAGADVDVVLSEPLIGVGGLPSALERARVLIQLQRAGGLSAGLIQAAAPESVGAFSWLVPLVAGEQLERAELLLRMAAFADGLLGPLDAADQRRSSELLPTLKAFLEHDGTHSAAAESLGIHRNTLAYRLERVAELLKADLGRHEVRQRLGFALLLRELLSAREAVEAGERDTMPGRGSAT